MNDPSLLNDNVADPAASQSLQSSVRDTARRDEPDRYLAALLAPAEASGALITLAAFAGELARIPASVSEPLIGEIRLQWWRDAVDAAGRREKCGHPVADALSTLMQTHGIDGLRLQRMIDARAFDLTGDLHADEAALDRHLAETEGLAFDIAHEILTGRPLPGSIAAQAGLGYGLARALGRLPASLHNGGFPIAETVLAQNGVTRSRLAERPFAAETRAGIGTAIRASREKIMKTLAEVRLDIAGQGSPGLVALLPLATVEPYLRALDGAGFQPLEHIADITPLTRIWVLLKARMSRHV